MAFSCGQKGPGTSKQSLPQEESLKESSNSVVSKSEKTSESVYVDPNRITFPSIGSVERAVNSRIGVRLEFKAEETSGEISLIRYNNYTKYADSSKEGINDFFVENKSGDGFYHSKDEDGRYSAFACDYFDQAKCYRDAYVGVFAGQEYVFSSNEEISYLNRECIKYTFNTDGSLIMDKETGLVLHYDLPHLIEGRSGDQLNTAFKFDVKEVCFGDDVKSLISQDVDNISVSPLDSSMLKNLGFEGDLETPHFAINNCSSYWQGENLSEYTIEYRENVNSGNDTYINQFETFTTCLYNMGFNRDSPDGSEFKDYETLVVDSTIDYDADISFAAYASKKRHYLRS